MMNLVVPSSSGLSDGAAQLVVFWSLFCCKSKPVEGKGHDTTTVLVDVRVMLSKGAPGIWMAVRIPQEAAFDGEATVVDKGVRDGREGDGVSASDRERTQRGNDGREQQRFCGSCHVFVGFRGQSRFAIHGLKRR